MNGMYPDIDLGWLKDLAASMDLDGDPKVLLRKINLAGGRVTVLRAYAKQRIAEAEAEG